MEFGLPLTPPYHDPSTKGTVILKGVSFASGGARILNEAGNFLQNVEPLAKQIQNFVRTRSEIIELFNGQEEAALNHLNKSIFIFAMGSNDYINYMNSSKSKPPQEFKNQMLTAYQQYLHQVYTLGARKVMVFGLGPLGCVPSKRESHGKACHEETNTLALDFDSGLLQMVKDMNSQLPDLKMVYGTTYSLFYDLANNPERYGFFSSSSACCGLTPRKLFACLPGGSVCPRRNEYVYWDAYHPTEAANRLVAKAILDGDSNYMYPFNLRQLASI